MREGGRERGKGRDLHANLPFIQGVVVSINQDWQLGLKQDL